jgi:hypothetical protein
VGVAEYGRVRVVVAADTVMLISPDEHVESVIEIIPVSTPVSGVRLSVADS